MLAVPKASYRMHLPTARDTKLAALHLFTKHQLETAYADRRSVDVVQCANCYVKVHAESKLPKIAADNLGAPPSFGSATDPSGTASPVCEDIQTNGTVSVPGETNTPWYVHWLNAPQLTLRWNKILTHIRRDASDLFDETLPQTNLAKEFFGDTSLSSLELGQTDDLSSNLQFATQPWPSDMSNIFNPKNLASETQSNGKKRKLSDVKQHE